MRPTPLVLVAVLLAGCAKTERRECNLVTDEVEEKRIFLACVEALPNNGTELGDAVQSCRNAATAMATAVKCEEKRNAL